MSKEKSILETKEKSISIEVKKNFDPKKFFVNRKGLYIWSSFTERIVSKAESTKKGFKFSVDSFDLVKNAIDKKIESALAENHLWDESDVAVIVAELIEKQSNGQEGTLLNNGYANLFYTGAFVVVVGWDGGEWGVGAWDRGDGGWGAGRRVFSPAN